MKQKLDRLFVAQKERYTNLNLDSVAVRIDVISDIPSYCKVALQGCASPIKIVCPFVFDSDAEADVTFHLSTLTELPNVNNRQRTAKKVKCFLFRAPNYSHNFKEDDVLFMCIESASGCEIMLQVKTSDPRADTSGKVNSFLDEKLLKLRDEEFMQGFLKRERQRRRGNFQNYVQNNVELQVSRK